MEIVRISALLPGTLVMLLGSLGVMQLILNFQSYKAVVQICYGKESQYITASCYADLCNDGSNNQLY